MEKGSSRNFVQTAITSVLVLAGIYLLFGQQTGGKRIVCSEHLDSAHALVNETHPSIADIPFDEYFYSPKLDTCVAGIVKVEDVLGENKAQTSYLILDIINNEEIWFALGTQYHQPQNEHEIKITQNDTEYRGGYYSELSKLQSER